MADHLLYLNEEVVQKLKEDLDMDDTFLSERVLSASQDLILWFLDIANFLMSDMVPIDLLFHLCMKFMYDVRKFF